MAPPILDLYSKRQKRARGEMPDVFQYKELPNAFKTQVVHILRDAIGVPDQFDNTVPLAYKSIHDKLAREYGVFSLNQDAQRGHFDASVYNYLLSEPSTDKALDVIELSFRFIDTTVREYEYRVMVKTKLKPDDAIEELNLRFIENGIGYQFESGQIIRMDSKVIHKEVIQPVLQLLSDQTFAGANKEFLDAHEHYRHERYKECLNDCLNSFESTMKTICVKRGWSFNKSDTASRLIEICFQNNLIPNYLQSHFGTLRTNLESGIPTIRNRESGHGQGEIPKKIPSYLASYMIYLTATTILLLINADKNYKK